MLQERQTPIGRLVAVREDHWRVADLVRHDDCEAWQLEGIGRSNRGERRTLLVPFDRPRPLPAGTGRGRRVGRRRGMLALRGLLAAAAGPGELRGATSAAMEIYDYQLEPALACLRGAARILVADEVGLGKTVQAGLLLAELRSRGEAERVLVLVPASLCEQWAGELRARFRLDPVVVDGATLRRLAEWSSVEEGPWARLPLAVASIDYVKQPEVLRGMGAVRWDLLVVDEAHGCSLAPHRAAALGWLARRARRVVLLTATPHAGDEDAFRSLCNAGRFAGEPPVTMFRRTRASLGGPPTRRVHLLRIRPTEAEARLHRGLAAYAEAVWRARLPRDEIEAARLAVTVLCKRAASGSAALLASLGRRLERLEARGDAGEASQLPLPLGDDPDREDEAPSEALGARGLGDAREERRILRALAALARAAAGLETKTRALGRLLSRAREPAIVFTEYRDTLEHLALRLAPLGAIVTLHGGLDRAARREAVALFTSGAARLMLATDAASHGLNLHAACRLVVDHDLPWSPARLEQRIGRVDRIGQARMVHAVHLAAQGTFEDRVLGRLALRVEAVRRSIGLDSSPLGRLEEEEVAAAVVEGRDPAAALPGALPVPPAGACGADFVTGDLRSEAREEARRLRAVRAWSSPRGRGDPAAVLADCVRSAPWRFAVRGGRCGLAPGLYAIYRVTIADARGTVHAEEVVPLFIPGFPGHHPGGAAVESWREVARALDEVAAGCARRVAAGMPGRWQAAVEAQRWREAQMAAVEAREPQPVQPGLFDRRALKASAEAGDRRGALAEETAARLRALDSAREPAIAHPPELLLAVVASRGRRPRAG